MPLHAIGNNGTIFYRFDLPTSKDAFHLNLFSARNWFQTPNTYDQLGQDQHPKNSTFNCARAISIRSPPKLFSPSIPFSVRTYVKLLSEPRSVCRHTGDACAKPDAHQLGSEGRYLLYHGRHNIKVGPQLMQTR